jgi:hypothetical protein
MSISAVNGVSPATPQTIEPETVAPVSAVTPFSQQLDAKNAPEAAAHGHHHHHGGASQSATSSAATAASAAGVTAPSTLASSLINLLS